MLYRPGAFRSWWFTAVASLMFDASVFARISPSPFIDVSVPAPSAISSGNDWVVPHRYRALELDHVAMRRILNQAPMEMAGSTTNGAIIELPMPDGTSQRFRYVESSIMEPALQAQFPDIRTYVGQGVDDPTATLRMDMTPAGFHAQILSAHGSVYIDPRTKDRTLYASYYKRDAAKTSDWFCGVSNSANATLSRDVVPMVALGTQLRTYRLACAATAEYTAFHGGTTNAGQAAIVTAINRVNGIYEREVAVRLNLVANNSLLVFTSAGSDGYTNDDGGLLLDENQTKVNAIIGPANYDIGHVFSTGGGGIASLGSVCDSNVKAQGVTGSSSPVGDPFYVDYVCHEIGHQFDAEHTFNSSEGSCGGGNRSGSTAFEVGSGSTILGYAGICNLDDVQNLSDDYFHAGSLDQISSFITTSISSCPVTTSTGNSIPTVSAGANYTIPRSTPFVLTATGSDANGDALTYCWEQMDLGPSTVLGAVDNGSSPLFRSFKPTTNTWRTFPSLTNILANTTNVAERLPTTARTMKFRATVRDNRAGGGGHNFDETLITVATNAGPFVVTNFNSSGVFSGQVTVGWSVAGTTNAPVSAAQVKIMLSTNGGVSFPITLNPSAPNTGSAAVTLPNISNNSARIMVQAANNIFFDINNANFSIRPAGVSTSVLISLVLSSLVSENCAPTNGVVDPVETVTMNFALGNFGNAPGSNIIATLLTTNGVLLPSAPKDYGTMAPGAVVTQSFSFTAGGVCGSNINPTLRIARGTNILSTVIASVSLGSIGIKTFSFTNSAAINIRDNSSALPYPSTITVANVQGPITKVTATLRGVTHPTVFDIDALLVGPNGANVMLMEYCGDGQISSAFVTLDDDASSSLPFTGGVTSGSYRPTSYSTNTMPSPAPTGPYGDALSVFNGIDPNGSWRLFVRDSADGSTGVVSSGWSISISTEASVCCAATPPSSQIQSSVITETNPTLILGGAGGVPRATNYLFSTTNLLIPFTNWSRISTNISDVNGFFGFTNVPGTNEPGRYFMIQSP